jgi:hypothetical protein
VYSAVETIATPEPPLVCVEGPQVRENPDGSFELLATPHHPRMTPETVPGSQQRRVGDVMINVRLFVRDANANNVFDDGDSVRLVPVHARVDPGKPLVCGRAECRAAVMAVAAWL